LKTEETEEENEKEEGSPETVYLKRKSISTKQIRTMSFCTSSHTNAEPYFMSCPFSLAVATLLSGLQLYCVPNVLTQGISQNAIISVMV
jgi:hypothetical protein